MLNWQNKIKQKIYSINAFKFLRWVETLVEINECHTDICIQLRLDSIKVINVQFACKKGVKSSNCNLLFDDGWYGLAAVYVLINHHNFSSFLLVGLSQ